MCRHRSTRAHLCTRTSPPLHPPASPTHPTVRVRWRRAGRWRANGRAQRRRWRCSRSTTPSATPRGAARSFSTSNGKCEPPLTSGVGASSIEIVRSWNGSTAPRPSTRGARRSCGASLAGGATSSSSSVGTRCESCSRLPTGGCRCCSLGRVVAVQAAVPGPAAPTNGNTRARSRCAGRSRTYTRRSTRGAASCALRASLRGTTPMASPWTAGPSPTIDAGRSSGRAPCSRSSLRAVCIRARRWRAFASCLGAGRCAAGGRFGRRAWCGDKGVMPPRG